MKKNNRKTRTDKIQLTQRDLKQIEKLSSFGLNQVQICSVLGISVDTLRRRLKEDNKELAAVLLKGKTEALTKVAKKAYDLAIKGNVSMIKYYLSTQGGWNENQQITQDESILKDPSEITMDDLVTEMTREERKKFRSILNEMKELQGTVQARIEAA
jgi:predicted DNA-binding protein (UPF0251 family)/predicted RNA-binding protein